MLHFVGNLHSAVDGEALFTFQGHFICGTRFARPS